MMKPMHACTRRQLLRISAGLLIAPALLPAQSAPASSSSAADDTVVLSPFRVDATQDRGYVGTNATTGTLLNTPLRDSPFGINVFTTQFIEDLGATTFREVLEYDASTVLDNTIEQGFGTGGLESGDNIANRETDVKVRGFPSPTLTNGFRTQVSVDTIGISRIERAGGPSSLLYGIGAMSGVTNNISKLPLNRPYTALGLGVGNYDYFRATLDTTAPLTSRLGYRLVGAWTDRSYQREFSDDRRQYLAGVVQFRPFEATDIVLDVNLTRRKEEGLGPRDVSLAGLLNPITGGGVQSMRDQYQQGRHVNLGGPDDYREYDSLTARMEIIQRFGRHITFLVAGQREDFDQDRQFIANFERRGNTNEVQYAWNFQQTDRQVDQLRANLLTTFELWGKHALALGRQEYSETTTSDLSEPWFRNFPTSSVFPQFNNRADGTNPLLSYLVLGPDARIRYSGQPYVPVSKLQTVQQWISGNYVVHQGQFWDDRVSTTVGYRWERSHNRRLETVAANHYENNPTRLDQAPQIYPRRNANDPDEAGKVVDPLRNRVTTVNGYANRGKPLTGGYPTAGISVRVVDPLSVYAQYAEGLALPSTAQRDGEGEAFLPQESKSKEVGIKFDLLDERISGRITVFQMERLNAVRYGFSLPAPYRNTFNPALPPSFNISANQAANPAGGATLQARTYLWNDPADRAALIAWHDGDRQRGGGGLGFNGGNNGHGNRGAYANFDEESEGIEVELNFNLTRAWSVRTSYTRNDVVVTRGIANLADQDLPGGFFSPFHPSFTTLGESNFTNGPRLGQLGSYTTDVRTSSFQDSQYGNFKKSDTPLHAFTFWNRYEFQDGGLRGLTLGGGARYQSERVTDFDHGRNDRPQESRSTQPGGGFVTPPVPENWLFDAFASYNRRIGGRDWSFQLNVRNLLDKQKLQRIGLPPEGSGITVPRTATIYLEPREIRLTATMRF